MVCETYAREFDCWYDCVLSIFLPFLNCLLCAKVILYKHPNISYIYILIKTVYVVLAMS